LLRRGPFLRAWISFCLRHCFFAFDQV
jgi:hypothetical protein